MGSTAGRDHGANQRRAVPAQMLRDARVDVALGEPEEVAGDAIARHRQAGLEMLGDAVTHNEGGGATGPAAS